jgi:hypothetical protein
MLHQLADIVLTVVDNVDPLAPVLSTRARACKGTLPSPGAV